MAENLPEGALRAGSLCNQKLINDAMMGVVGKVAVKGCEAPESFLAYVTQMPTGIVGSQTWNETWIVTGCGNEYAIKIVFREDGAGGAMWTIE